MLGLGATTQHTDLSWNPSFLSKTIHWYRKAHVTLDAEGDVTGWLDSSVASNNMTQDGSASKSPILSADGAVVFDTASVLLDFGSEINLEEYDIYVRMKFDESITISNEDLFEKDGNNFLRVVSPTALRYKIGGTRHDVTVNEIVEGETFTVSASRASNGDMKVYIDGALGSWDSDEGNEDIATTFDFSILGKPSAISHWYEIVICNAPLTDKEKVLMDKYLSHVVKLA